MATHPQLVNFLRFRLASLSAENGHHQFEHVCRQLARATIARNILPATGPVSAGGDQGRDFETFVSYLAEELGPHEVFVGVVSDEPIAFVCTLQQAGVEGKIAADVETVVGSGEPVARIYAMCSADVPVARRNRLKKETREKHRVELEVLDGSALAEVLAEPELFWIAADYLSIPAEFAPERPVGDAGGPPEWYRADRRKWLEDRGELRVSLGDLLDAADGLRYATVHPDAREDLDRWLALFEPFLESGVPSSLRQRARYEYIVATLRGHEDLRPVEGLVKEYLEDALPEEDTSRLQDAAVLLMFVVDAHIFGVTALGPAYIAEVNQRLRDQIRTLLGDAETPGRTALLSEVLGFLSLQPDPTQIDRPHHPLPLPTKEELRVLLDGAWRAGMPRTTLPLIDVEGGMRAWTDLVDLLPQAPLLPVDTFARLVDALAPILVDQPGWRHLVDELAEAVKRTSGNAAAAEHARDRALALLKSDRLLDSLRELHSAKVDWWSGDTLRGALLSMLLIADIYQRLQLPLAAKQYALAAAVSARFSGDDDVLDLVPQGLLAAANADYHSGAWCGAVELYEVALLAYHHLTDSGLDLEREELQAALAHLGMASLAARDFAPALLAPIDAVIERTGLTELIVPQRAELPHLPESDWASRAAGELSGLPFSDAGAERVIRFAALGTDWVIRSSTAYSDARAAERFAAATQVLLVELAEEDLCLLPTRVDVTVQTSPTPVETDDLIEWAPSNDARLWRVTLVREPPAGNSDHVFEELLIVLSRTLIEASLLPGDAFMQSMERAFEHGLSHKLTSGRPYDELAAVIDRDRYDHSNRPAGRPPADPAAFELEPHPALAWQDGPGPTFTPEAQRELLEARYRKLPHALRATLPALQADIAFLSLVAHFRDEGWKDWHILAATANVAWNWRLQHREEGPPTVAESRTLKFEDEKAGSPPVPLRVFTREALEWGRRSNLLASLQQWDLQINAPTPDIDGIERVMVERYGYWRDDIDHGDPFPGLLPLPTG